MGKSRRRKKIFDCGCSGYGKFCHRCKDIANGRLIEVGGKWLPAKKESV